MTGLQLNSNPPPPHPSCMPRGFRVIRFSRSCLISVLFVKGDDTRRCSSSSAASPVESSVFPSSNKSSVGLWANNAGADDLSAS
ncbi:uncharacterized [Tachysurus ichikawai]